MDSETTRRTAGASAEHRRNGRPDDAWGEFDASVGQVRRMRLFELALAGLASVPLVATSFWIHQEWRDAIEALLRFR